MDTNTIKVMNSKFDFLGDIEDYISFYFVRNFTKAKEFQIVAPIKYIDILKDDNIIFINPKKAAMIEEISIDESKNIITAKGRDLKSIVGRRITVPPTGKVYDEIKSNVETVINHYVINNCINPVDPKRKIQELEVSTNKNRGKTLAWQSRFKYLDFEIEQICNAAGIGFEVYLDLDKKKFIFDIVEGIDRTKDLNSRVIFSEEFDNITESTHTNNSLSYKTMGYVAGQGEGEDRAVKEVFKTSELGLKRRELYIDARDIEKEDNLEDRAKSKLAEYDYITSNESTVINSNFEYEKDWNLGDVVLLKNVLGESVQRIVEVTEIYEGYRKIEIVLGNVIPLPTEKITNEINSIPTSEGSSKMWRPSVDSSGNLIWTLNSSLDIPVIENIKGPKGDKGDIGSRGLQGIQGLKGDTGERGLQGIQGIQGPKGDIGNAGARGFQGVQGVKGDKINHQWNGTILKLENPDGSFDLGINLKGEKGDTGVQGLKGDTGARGPQGVQGPAGDGQSYVVFHQHFVATQGQQNFSWNDGYVYPVGINAIAVYLNGARLSNRIINQTSGNSIQFKVPLNEGDRVFIEAMQAVKDLQGPQGIQGPKGDKGNLGERGPKGDTGLTGAKGSRGPQGIQGIQGSKGDRGSQGIQGPKGDKGDTGSVGARGITGSRGPQGPRGNTGPAGKDGTQIITSRYTPSGHVVGRVWVQYV